VSVTGLIRSEGSLGGGSGDVMVGGGMLLSGGPLEVEPEPEASGGGAVVMVPPEDNAPVGSFAEGMRAPPHPASRRTAPVARQTARRLRILIRTPQGNGSFPAEQQTAG
jgi:hypothetical protein